MKKNKGFTIIELMITVAIIGIFLALFIDPKEGESLEQINQRKHLGDFSQFTDQKEAPQTTAPINTNPVFVRD